MTRRILLNISRRKGNRSMKFGQLIEYNMNNVFLQKSCTNYGGESNSRTFLWKVKIEHISWSTIWNIIKFVFIALSCWDLPICIKTADHLLSPHIKLFQKTKRGLTLVSVPHFFHEFRRKVFFTFYFHNWPNLIAWLRLLLEILDKTCITRQQKFAV